MVEHAFSRPDLEVEWNTWYATNLRILMSVQGFRTGQRFKGVGLREGAPAYMAMYTLDSGDVLDSQVYKAAGGGGTNSEHFRVAYKVWVRNLFEELARAPGIGPNQYLLAADFPTRQPEALPGATWMRCTGLHKTTGYRALLVTNEPPAKLPPNSLLYRAMTPQMPQLY